MPDQNAITKPASTTWVEAFTTRAREGVKGSLAKVGQSGIGPYARGVGATAIEVGEGFAVGALLGAAKARFGIDASPGLMGAAAIASIVASDVAPAAADHLRAIAGQSAAVMADRSTQRFLTGWPSPSSSPVMSGAGGMKSVGAGAHGESNMGGDRILQKAAEIARRSK